MRGVIATFDAGAGVGTIRGKDERIYPFTRSDLVVCPACSIAWG